MLACYTIRMAFSFFSKQRGALQVLLVDIGSASVGVALARLQKNKEPHIIATHRESIPFQGMLSSSRFLLAMNQSLEVALKHVHLELKGATPPKHVFCSLSSPWFILKNRSICIEQTTAFKVTEKNLYNFLDEDIALLKDEIKEAFPIKDVALVEKKIIQIKLNGYEVQNPYGRMTSQLEAVAVLSLSSKKVITSIEQKIGKFFHTKSLHFGAFPIALFSAIRDIFPEEKNFIFLDITGEATDVSYVKNDLIIDTQSFHCGKNFFIREISTYFKTHETEAATLFKMFLEGTLDKKMQSDLSKVIVQISAEWAIRFEKSLTKFSKFGVLPKIVFFTSDDDVAPLFKNLIKNTRLSTLSRSNFEASYFDQYIVAKFVTFDSGVLRDPFLVVEALLAEKSKELYN